MPNQDDPLTGLESIMANHKRQSDLAEAEVPMPQECCGRCKYGLAVRTQPGQPADLKIRECHAQPPHMQFFPMPQMNNKDQQVGVQMMEHSGWPKVPTVAWCAHYRPPHSI